MRSGEKAAWDRIAGQVRRGAFHRAFRDLGTALGRKIALPRGLEVFFPARDGRQDLMYEQDFGLEPHRAAFERARKAAASSRLPSVEKDMLAGYCDLFTGDYARALKTLARAAKAEPAAYWPNFLHACALWLHGDKRRTRDYLPDTLDAIQKALAVDSKRKYAYVIRAGVKRELEDVPGRLEDAERVIKMDPDFVWARTERAEVLSEEGHYRPALSEANRLIRLYPKRGWAWAQRGRIRGISGYYKLALKDFERAVELDPKCGPLVAWVGETKRRLGRYGEAMEDLERAIGLDPGYRLAHVWKGRIDLLLGRFAEASRSFSTALRIEPREMLAQAWRGEARWKAGEARLAAADFEAIYPAEPKMLWNARLRENETQEYYFMLSKAGGKREEAFWTDIAEGTSRRPLDAWAWAFSGRAKLGAGRLDDGLGDLTRALQLDRKLAYAYAWRGEAVRRLGAPKRSLRDLDRAVKLEPKNLWAWAFRGRALADAGRRAEALSSLSKALKTRAQRFALAHVWRGEVLWAMGRSKEAGASFRRAFLLDGKCKPAKAWIKKAAASPA